MALKRVIPCLDVDAGRVVKGTNFVGLRDAGDPVELAARYDAEGADELVFLDITASHERRETIVELARRTADNVFIPFTIGGGIRSVDDAQAVLDAGADKVSVNSAALARPGADRRARRGLRLPVRRDRDRRQAQRVRRRGIRLGRLRERRPHPVEGREAVAWAREATERGAGEVLLTSMDRDGTTDGYDLELTRAVADAVAVPVIASGGAGELSAPRRGDREGGADAVLCASIFHYGTHTFARRSGRCARPGSPSAQRRSGRRDRDSTAPGPGGTRLAAALLALRSRGLRLAGGPLLRLRLPPSPPAGACSPVAACWRCLGLASLRLSRRSPLVSCSKARTSTLRSGRSASPSEITGLYSPWSDSKTFLPVLDVEAEGADVGPDPET